MALALKKGIVSMKPEASETRKCRLVIGALFSFGLMLSACRARTEAEQKEYDQRIAASSRIYQQQYLDQASIVCRDGTAYLAGYVDRSMFLSPYVVNGQFISCDDNGNVVTQKKSAS